DLKPWRDVEIDAVTADPHGFRADIQDASIKRAITLCRRNDIILLAQDLGWRLQAAQKTYHWPDPLSMMSASSLRAASHSSGLVLQLIGVRTQLGSDGSSTPYSHNTLGTMRSTMARVRSGSAFCASTT